MILVLKTVVLVFSGVLILESFPPILSSYGNGERKFRTCSRVNARKADKF